MTREVSSSDPDMFNAGMGSGDPVADRLGLTWVWMGAPDDADTDDIFDSHGERVWTSICNDDGSANLMPLTDYPWEKTYVPARLQRD